jgi:hypothetical protein
MRDSFSIFSWDHGVSDIKFTENALVSLLKEWIKEK